MEVDTQAVALLEAYRAEVKPLHKWWHIEPGKLAAGQAILRAAPQVQVAVMRAALDPLAAYSADTGGEFPNRLELAGVHDMCFQLSRRALPYTPDDVRAILRAMAAAPHPYSLPVQALLRAVARPLADPATLAACRPELERVRAAAAAWYDRADVRRFRALLGELFADGAEDPSPVRSDEWGDQVRPLLDGIAEPERGPWLALLRHFVAASGSVPSARWADQARRLVADLGPQTFARLATTWLGAFRRTSNKPPQRDPETSLRTGPGSLLVDENANLLRGLAWASATVADAGLAAALGDAAIAGYRKITGVGPRSARVAGACVYALENMPGRHGAAQLDRVRLGVKQPTYVRAVERALDAAAERAGMTREDLEELTVPTFDLRDGRLRVPFGPAAAELRVGGCDVSLGWLDAAGRPRKSAPAAVAREHKDALKELKRQRDEMARMLAAQRDRLERLSLAGRRWPLPTWRERYLDHPLVGTPARRLIWRFDDGDRVAHGAWLDGRLVDAGDRPLDLRETTEVTPWHPALCTADEVLAWRIWLERHRVTQPFKQAHREVYLLTDAERATRVYSNRFAAHILRQHQFNALAAARGWRNQLRLMVDDSYPPATLDLPRWGLRAEFWVEGAGDDYGVDTNETGTYLRVATDQVRFYRPEAAQNFAHAGGGGYAQGHRWYGRQPAAEGRDAPVPLEQIPPLVFSEVMRDVDLFVGVASVGNDPTWQDGGPAGRYRDYWQSYSFGELSATAETRKALLARLVPRLAIADRCAISDRFLVVRGDRRTYKIHLGSGNILMEPNDQYLCIVPGRSADAGAGDLYLPFEGDSLLAIILSKAFLLADDKKIADPTITRQLAGA